MSSEPMFRRVDELHAIARGKLSWSWRIYWIGAVLWTGGVVLVG